MWTLKWTYFSIFQYLEQLYDRWQGKNNEKFGERAGRPAPASIGKIQMPDGKRPCIISINLCNLFLKLIGISQLLQAAFETKM